MPTILNKDVNGNVQDDPTDPQNKQLLQELNSFGGTILPTIGLIIKI